MELNLVAEGLKFMVLGMVTVFLFLILMVLVLNVQSKLINKLFPPKATAQTPGGASTKTASRADDTAVIAAITAAIQEFRTKKS